MTRCDIGRFLIDSALGSAWCRFRVLFKVLDAVLKTLLGTISDVILGHRMVFLRFRHQFNLPFLTVAGPPARSF